MLPEQAFPAIVARIRKGGMPLSGDRTNPYRQRTEPVV
ncbi:hypothetical protein [Azospirillum largimobile]